MRNLSQTLGQEVRWQVKLIALQLRKLVTDHWIPLALLLIIGTLVRAFVWWELAAPIIPLSKWMPNVWEIGTAILFYLAISLYIAGFAMQSEVVYENHTRGNRGILSISLVVVSAFVALSLSVPYVVVLIVVALMIAAHVPRQLDALGRGAVSHVAIMVGVVFILWMMLVA